MKNGKIGIKTSTKNLLGMELHIQEQLQTHSVCTIATACRIQISQRIEGQKTWKSATCLWPQSHDRGLKSRSLSNSWGQGVGGTGLSNAVSVSLNKGVKATSLMELGYKTATENKYDFSHPLTPGEALSYTWRGICGQLPGISDNTHPSLVGLSLLSF